LSQFSYFGPCNFGVFASTTLKRYCIQMFTARHFRELARLANFAK